MHFYLSKKSIKMELVPERFRGETAAFDIKIGRKTIVEREERGSLQDMLMN